MLITYIHTHTCIYIYIPNYILRYPYTSATAHFHGYYIFVSHGAIAKAEDRAWTALDRSEFPVGDV